MKLGNGFHIDEGSMSSVSTYTDLNIVMLLQIGEKGVASRGSELHITSQAKPQYLAPVFVDVRKMC